MSKLHRTPKSVKDVYRGYMPANLPQHRPPNRIKHWWKVAGKPFVTIYPKEQIEGYSEEAEYPPLSVAGGIKGANLHYRLDWYDSLKKIPTNTGKLLEIGKYAQHYMAHINNWLTAYNSLPMIQYLTRTKLIDSLPANYSSKQTENLSEEKIVDNNGADPSKQLLDQIRPIILNQIALDNFESEKLRPRFVSKSIRDGNKISYVSNNFVQNLVSGLKRALSLEVNPQLLDYQYDLSPAIRSWWFHSGLKPPNNRIYFKSRKDKDGNINQMIQMNGSSALNIRATGLIEPVISQTDPLVTDTSLVQNYNYPLRYYGAKFKFKWPVALPGFWFEDEPKFDFPHTCFLSTDCLRLRSSGIKTVTPFDDDEDCLNGQAILTAFGWLNSLSMYHGFTPYQEIEYPFTCQVITTDGQNWLFNVYQMNSHTFHRDLGGPKKNNICWTSGKMKLFEEYADGEFKGVNDDVIKLIIRFLAQQTSPEYTSQLNLRPFLGADESSQEEKDKVKFELRKLYEGRISRYRPREWKVALWEHIFFRSPQGRNRITEMKAPYHSPKPKMPKNFE